ncbi:MAG: two-component system NtrC family sensor kinase [Candidatus Endobugula sp.]|jgi:two-component system NtrC family sensor kinase
MSLRLKTILGVGIIEAILLMVLISTVLSYMRLSNEGNLEDYVDTTTKLFVTTTKDAVLSFDLSSLEHFVEEMLTNKGLLYARIFDGDDRLLASGSKPNYVQQPFKDDASYQHVDDSVYDSSAIIAIDGTIYGRIEIGFSTQKIEQAIDEARALAATIALVKMLLVALFSFVLGGYLTSQLKVLKHSAKRIAAGDLNQKIDVKTRDEIGEVADSFNIMLSSLRAANKKSEEHQQELILLNKTLEERVDQRTEKIMQQKEKLQSSYEQLQYTQKQLVQSEKMASIGQLAAGVAHEINNPVAFVKSNLTSLAKYINTYKALIDKQQRVLVSMSASTSAKVKQQLDNISHYVEEEDIEFIHADIDVLVEESIIGTNRVAEIIKGLKVYSRASDDIMEDCDVNACLQDTLKMLNNEIKYSCEVVQKIGVLPVCFCNRGKITQVFTNLIVNAVHSMGATDTGVLTVETFCKESLHEKTLHEKTRPTAEVVIKISDTGQGIPEENLSKLFDPFFTTKDVGEGTGLGLSISQGIIDDHGGRMEVESTVGKGTAFTLTLPINTPPAL